MLIPVDRDTLAEACLMLAVHERDVTIVEAGPQYSEYAQALRRVLAGLLATLGSAGVGVTWAGVVKSEECGE